MSSTWLRAVTMSLSLPPGCLQRLMINRLAQLPPWRSVVNCVGAFSCFCFSFGCSARWEAVGPDSILPARGTGKEGWEAFLPEASPRDEAEAFRGRARGG